MESYDLTIYKGQTYSLGLTVKDAASVPLNLSGYSISGFLKINYTTGTYLTSLNPVINLPYTGGSVTLSIPASGTANLPCTIGFFDVEIMSSGDSSVTKILRGKAYISPEVTF